MIRSTYGFIGMTSAGLNSSYDMSTVGLNSTYGLTDIASAGLFSTLSDTIQLIVAIELELYIATTLFGSISLLCSTHEFPLPILHDTNYIFTI